MKCYKKLNLKSLGDIFLNSYIEKAEKDGKHLLILEVPKLKFWSWLEIAHRIEKVLEEQREEILNDVELTNK